MVTLLIADRHSSVWDWDYTPWLKLRLRAQRLNQELPTFVIIHIAHCLQYVLCCWGLLYKTVCWVSEAPNKTGLQVRSRIFVTFCAQRSLNLHSGLWCSRTEGGHFNGGWIILPAKTSCCSKVIALRSTLASVSGQCTPEVDILSDQFASSKQDRAIFQPRNRMFSQDPLSFFFQLDN